MKIKDQGEKTLFIVGAGASAEVNMPTGQQLRSQISTLTDLWYEDGHRLSRGDQLLASALRLHMREASLPNFKSLQSACQGIASAMPQAISIDNYLDAHKKDPLVVLCGKVAIARAILDAEAQSHLAISDEHLGGQLDFKRIENTWFAELMRLVTENVGFGDLPGRLSKLAFVVFNYDRALEHFLVHWIANYYRVQNAEAQGVVSAIEIHHPYGIVGPLPWNDPKRGVAYGASVNAKTLLGLAGELRTFTEGMDVEQGGIDQIRERVARSPKIIFLGFAFHPLNMELLRPKRPASPGSTCFATAKGLSDYACGTVRAELAKWITSDKDMVYIKNSLTCSGLFSEYGRGLAIAE